MSKHMLICQNQDCSDEVYCRGLCCACYQYQRRYGRRRDPLTVGRGHERIEIPNLDEIIRRYRAGDTLRELAKDAPVSTTTLRKRLAEAGVEIRAGHPPRTWSKAEIRQARYLYHEEGVPGNEIAEMLDVSYQTLIQTVRGRINRTVGGPMPLTDDEEMTPCVRCGVLSRRDLCRYCRTEER